VNCQGRRVQPVRVWEGGGGGGFCDHKATLSTLNGVMGCLLLGGKKLKIGD